MSTAFCPYCTLNTAGQHEFGCPNNPAMIRTVTITPTETHHVFIDPKQIEIDALRAAIKGLLAEPYGCPMCDSGVLRNPVNPATPKEHHPDCPYAIASKLVEG